TDFDMGDPMHFYADDVAAYLQHEWEPLDWLKILYGIRYNYFAQKGPFTRYTIDNVYNFNNLDSTYYAPGEVVQAYHLWEPRVNFRFQLSKTQSIKASYTLNQQCMNLAALFEMSMPTDVWLPATELLKPQKSHQFTLGYFKNLFDNKVEISLETYYKKMYNLLELKQNANILNSVHSNIDYMFTEGEGQSYGAELFINKTVGNFTGWLGYTLSWTNRNFDEILDGKTFPARNDRRHDVSLMLNYNLKDKWVFSVVWVFSSGNASTIPNSFYIIDGKLYSEMGEHNAWRMPDYHRMDLSATWHMFDKKHTAGDLNFSVYNVYNRHNPFFISYTAEGDLAAGKMQIKAYQMSIFPILPSVSFNLKIR
ncbi:MAG: TonB-dependent receptor, partial [Bacteroidales bacterium]|nr:TonB-dependent receptor [Bacteroidales bacterium]